MIRFRLLVGFILVGLLPVIGVGVGTYLISYQNGRQQALDRLESIAARKELSIQVWIQSLAQDLQVAAQTDVSPKLVVNALKLSNEGFSYSWYNNLVRKRLQRFVGQSPQLEELFLVDMAGNLVVSTNPQADLDNYKEKLSLIEGFGDNYIELPFLTNGNAAGETDFPNVIFLSRVVNDDGTRVGWIGGKFKLNPLLDILQENTGLGETGIAYLVNWDHSLLAGTGRIFLNGNEQGVFRSINTESVNAVIRSGANIKGIFSNPIGIQVLGNYRWMPELKVVLCVEQETREALKGVFANATVNLVIAFGALVVAVVAALYMTQTIANPIIKLAHTASQIAHGDWEQTAVIERDDEVGALAIAFNSMTDQLKELINSLEQRVEERTRDLQNANKELNQRALQLETSAKVARDITSILNIDLLLKRVVELIQESFNFYHVQVFLLEKENNKLVLGASSGDRKIQHRQIPIDGRSLNSLAILSGNTQVANEVEQTPNFLYDEGLPDTQSEVVIPLRVGGQAIGTLDIHINQAYAFKDEEIMVLQSLGDQIAIAIENARLYNQSRDLAVLEERNRLARELHDSVTQSLYSLMLLTEGWRRTLNGQEKVDIESYLSRIKEISARSLKEMRLLIMELRPPTLDQEGLVGALQKRLDAVEKRVGIKARVMMEEFCDLPIAVEKELYWIAQEALNNSLKHANASQVTVLINVEGPSVILRVIDDGIGFDVQTAQSQGGMGLFNMRERATRLGGSLVIESTIGSGTVVTACVPLSLESA
jgi:nitrate/nitrite-specific signal transduction histidine kinase